MKASRKTPRPNLPKSAATGRAKTSNLHIRNESVSRPTPQKNDRLFSITALMQQPIPQSKHQEIGASLKQVFMHEIKKLRPLAGN